MKRKLKLRVWATPDSATFNVSCPAAESSVSGHPPGKIIWAIRQGLGDTACTKAKGCKAFGIDSSIRFHFPFVLLTTRRLRHVCLNPLHVPAAKGAKYQMWERTVWYLCSVFMASIMPKLRVCAATLSSCVLQCPRSFQASNSMPTSHGPQRPNLKHNSPEC